MDLQSFDDIPERRKLTQQLIDLTAKSGWRKDVLDRASEAALGDTARWRGIFPAGARDAIWHISSISDASMREAFVQPAQAMSEVIAERFAQNRDLKPFVWRVMIFDFFHPVQALARMQRTAKVMFSCLSLEPKGFLALTALNITYTLIVFSWLFDANDLVTQRLTKSAMKLIGQS